MQNCGKFRLECSILKKNEAIFFISKGKSKSLIKMSAAVGDDRVGPRHVPLPRRDAVLYWNHPRYCPADRAAVEAIVMVDLARNPSGPVWPCIRPSSIAGFQAITYVATDRTLKHLLVKIDMEGVVHFFLNDQMYYGVSPDLDDVLRKLGYMEGVAQNPVVYQVRQLAAVAAPAPAAVAAPAPAAVAAPAPAMVAAPAPAMVAAPAPAMVAAPAPAMVAVDGDPTDHT